jgi:MSHA pilin protein MshB
MKTLNAVNRSRSGQQGFTIIELVVVILLLGILTATALPRFMDVSDEAHGAIVDGVRGGLLTGDALFHAEWMARGEQSGTALTSFNSNFPNSAGYSVGLDADTDQVLSDSVECQEIFIGLLQTGRPVVAESGVGTSGAIVQTYIDTAVSASADFMAHFTGSTTCTFAYIGQFSNMATETIPTLALDTATGAVTEGSL